MKHSSTLSHTLLAMLLASPAIMCCATAGAETPAATPPPAAPPLLPRTAKLLADKKPVRLVLYGDSISEVGRSPSWHGGASAPEHNWGSVLGTLLTRAYPGTTLVVQHFGIGGQNSYEGLGRLDALAAFKPDLVVVAFGANDCCYHYLLPEETQLALTSLAKGIRERYGADVVLAGTAGDNPQAPLFRHTAETVAAQRAAAVAAGAPFVDLQKAMVSATDNGKRWAEFNLAANNCHPNDAGHLIWAAAAAAAIREALAQ